MIVVRVFQAVLFVAGVLGLSQLGTDFKDARGLVNGWLGTDMSQREFGFAIVALAAIFIAISVYLEARRAPKGRQPDLGARAFIDDYGSFWLDVTNKGDRADVEARAVIRQDAPFTRVEVDEEDHNVTYFRMSWDWESGNSWEDHSRRLVWHDDEKATYMPISRGETRRIRLGNMESRNNAFRFNFIDRHDLPNYRESAGYIGKHDDFIVELILTSNPQSKEGVSAYLFRINDYSIEPITQPLGPRVKVLLQKPVRAVCRGR